MKAHAFRLKQGQDLRKMIENYSKDHNIKAGIILTCVGSLEYVAIRTADSKTVKEYNDKYEIASLAGTISPDGVHLHIAFADKDAVMYGGHLRSGRVYTTAEVVIGELKDIVFSRELDCSTGFKELVVGDNHGKA